MYQIQRLLKYSGLFHAFSMKEDGNMANSILGKVVDFENVLENRKRFLSGLGVDINKCVCMWVTHGDKIVNPTPKSIGISMQDYKKAVKVDGLITDNKGVYLFLLVADCLPVILYDPIKKAIGLIHAGWKGVDLEIAGKSVLAMNETYGCNPKDIIVGVGPCAHKDSFIKKNPDQKEDLIWKPYMEKVDVGKYKIDLIGFTEQQLLQAGILGTNIYISEIDTVKDERFFSHVREGSLPLNKQGRFACVIGLNT